MAPTSIDGNEITGATIDGQDVSEITVDGQTVFTAIPDSAIHRFKYANNYNDSIGSLSASADGTSFFADANLQGGFGLDIGGAGDGVTMSTIGGEIGINQSFTVCLTINLDNLSTAGTFYEHQSENFNRVIGAVENDEIFFNLYDGSDYGAGLGANESTTNRMRLALRHTGTLGEQEIWKNGTNQTNTGNGDTADSTLQTGHSIGYNAGKISGKSGNVDDLIIYSTALSASEIQQDYNIQPWS